MVEADPGHVLTLLELGEVEAARKVLAARFAEEPRAGALASPRERLAYRLHLVLGSRQPPPEVGVESDAAPAPRPGGAGEEGDAAVLAAIRALDHVLLGSAALRSGRVEALVVEADAALHAAPRSMPWVVFCVGSLLQACYRFTGEASLRESALEVLGRLADRLDLPHVAVQARALMGNVHMLHGALHPAIEHCDAALALAAAAGVDGSPSTAMAHQFRGYVLFEWNRLADAERALGRAWELAGPGGRGVRSGVARMMARLRAAAGDGVDAERWLDRLGEVVAEPMTLRNREWLTAVRVRQSLGTGDLAAVDEWLRTYDYRPPTIASMDPKGLLARLHELDQALALLEATEQWTALLVAAPSIARTADAERPWFAARAATCEAVALEALGRAEEADARFDHALALGEAGAFVRAYVEGSRLRGVLLQRAASRGSGGSARRVLEAAPEVAGITGGPSLTAAQTAVLRRVAAGASNKAIAREMGVSVTTVKTHLRTVFAKLDASSRTHAVVRAREAGIL